MKLASESSRRMALNSEQPQKQHLAHNVVRVVGLERFMAVRGGGLFSFGESVYTVQKGAAECESMRCERAGSHACCLLSPRSLLLAPM